MMNVNASTGVSISATNHGRGVGLRRAKHLGVVPAIKKLKTTLREDEQPINPNSLRAIRSRRRHFAMGGGNGICTRASFHPSLPLGGKHYLDGTEGNVMVESGGTAGKTQISPSTPRRSVQKILMDQATNTSKAEGDEATLSTSELPVSTAMTPESLNKVHVRNSASSAYIVEEFRKDYGIPSTSPLKYTSGVPNHPRIQGSLRAVGFSAHTKGNGISTLKTINVTPPSKEKQTLESGKVPTIARYMRATISSTNKATPTKVATPSSHIQTRKSELVPLPRTSNKMMRKSEFCPRGSATKTLKRLTDFQRKSTLFGVGIGKPFVTKSSTTPTTKSLLDRKAWNSSTSTSLRDQSSNVQRQSNTYGPTRKIFFKPSSTNTNANPNGSGKNGLTPLKAMSLKTSTVSLNKVLRDRTSSGSDKLNVTFTVQDAKEVNDTRTE